MEEEVTARIVVDLEVVLDENGNPVLDDNGKPIVRSRLTNEIITNDMEQENKNAPSQPRD